MASPKSNHPDHKPTAPERGRAPGSKTPPGQQDAADAEHPEEQKTPPVRKGERPIADVDRKVRGGDA